MNVEAGLPCYFTMDAGPNVKSSNRKETSTSDCESIFRSI